MERHLESDITDIKRALNSGILPAWQEFLLIMQLSYIEAKKRVDKSIII